MQIIAGLLCLVLLLWIRPAVAQSTHELKVSRHPSIALSDNNVRAILAGASRVLQNNSVFRGDRGRGACDVTFKLKGSVETLSPNIPAVVDEDNIEDVHRDHSDPNLVSVKVV